MSNLLKAKADDIMQIAITLKITHQHKMLKITIHSMKNKMTTQVVHLLPPHCRNNNFQGNYNFEIIILDFEGRNHPYEFIDWLNIVERDFGRQ